METTSLGLKKPTLQDEVDDTINGIYSSMQIIDDNLKANANNIVNTNNSINTFNAQLNDNVQRLNLGGIPNFYIKNAKQEEDVTVIMVGESIVTANSYTSDRDDATSRPPLCHQKNLFSYIEEYLRWKGQEYLRYDSSSIFTENATTKTTVDYDSAWDWQVGYGFITALTSNFKPATTRILSGTNASVSYTYPANMRRCDFIYRTDYLCATTTTVTIAEGNGKVEVYDETTQTWVEANGYSFSAKETDIIMDYSHTGYDGIVTPLKLRKSIYQKRLKMRSLSVLTAKTVTITNIGSGRLNYWGIEYSPKSNMICIINNARGGHDLDMLKAFEAWDVDYWKPDLIIHQTNIINEGAMSSPNMPTVNKPSDFVQRFSNYADNLMSKTYNPDLLPITLFIGSQSNIVDQSTGKYNVGNIVGYGDVTVFNYIGNLDEMYRNKKLMHINCFSEFLSKAEEKATNDGTNNIWTSAIAGSSKIGNTFTIDGVHLNDYGNLLAKNWVIPSLKSLLDEKLINTNDSVSNSTNTDTGIIPACRVYNIGNQSITNASLVTLSFNTERYDTANMHSTVTNNSRLVAPKDGLYAVKAHICFSSNATGIRAVNIVVNGTTDICDNTVNAINGSDCFVISSTTINLTAGDYVEVKVLHTAGTTINVLAGEAYSPEFSMEYLGKLT